MLLRCDLNREVIFIFVCRFDMIFVRDKPDDIEYGEYEDWKTAVAAKIKKFADIGVSSAPRKDSPRELSAAGTPRGTYGDVTTASTSNAGGAPASVVEAGVEGSSSAGISQSRATAKHRGMLQMRPAAGGQVNRWPEYEFHLVPGYLSVYSVVQVSLNQVAARHNNKSASTVTDTVLVEKHRLSPNSIAFETTLGPNSFEVVTTNTILHLCARSSAEMHVWMQSVKAAAAASVLDPADPLFQMALLKIDLDEIFQVSFNVKAPLGVVFEKTGEWAIVRSTSTDISAQIPVGSVLTSINGESVILKSYSDVVSRLRGWQPPLRLTFRRVPPKTAYLLKQSKSKKSEKVVWRKRYFVLANRCLSYKEKESDTTFRFELPLMGAIVTILQPAEGGGRENCFRVLSGVSGVVVQCANHRQVSGHVLCI